MVSIKCHGVCPHCLCSFDQYGPNCKFCGIELNIKSIDCPICETEVQKGITKCPNCNLDLQYVFDLYKRILHNSQALFKADFIGVTFERGRMKRLYSDEEIETFEQQKNEDEHELMELIKNCRQVYINKVKAQEKKEKLKEIDEKYGSYKNYKEHIEEEKAEYNRKIAEDDYKRDSRKSTANAILWSLVILLLLLSSCLG